MRLITGHLRGAMTAAALLIVALTVSGCTAGGSPGTPQPGSAYATGTAAPPALDTLKGDLSAHDPSIVVGGSAGNAANASPDWFVYSTGDPAAADGNIQIRRSADGVTWKSAGTVWKTKPSWLTTAVPGVTNLWAPELHREGDTWYLYYSASTFGSNRSVIALATNTTLDPDAPGYDWVDRGPVIASTTSDDFNAIDPAVVVDAAGHPHLAFGSFWSGIRMVGLVWPSGLQALDAAAGAASGSGAAPDVASGTEPLRLADRGSPPNAIEGATIVPHDGAYFLIVSRDSCCRGVASTYNMAVGRATSVEGPYVDRDGVPLLADGGTPLLASAGTRVGPGGESYSDGYLAWHYYDKVLGGAVQLAVAPLEWDAAGWPRLAAG